MIAILCPTRGRPEQYARMVKSVLDTASNAAIFAGVAEDEPFVSDGRVTSDVLRFPDMLPTAQKWNLLAMDAMNNDSRNKLFMLGADDMIFETPGWDKALIDHYNALENKIHVYALRDSRDPEGFPHPVVSREFVDAMGYAFVPIFMHWFLDTWTVEIAKANNCFTHFKDYKLTHDKPSDRGRPDQTHSRIREFGWHGRDKWVAEKMAHVLEGEKKRLKEKINVF